MTSVDQAAWTGRKSMLALPDGRPMTFVDSGGSGPILLMLHGYSDTSRSFSLLESQLAGYRLIMTDLPGHGGSAAGSGLTVGAFAEDIAAFVEAFGIDRCVVIGHSMGAMTGMVLTDLLPQAIEALVLISGTLRPAFSLEDPVSKGIHRLSDPIDPADPFFDLWHSGPHPLDRAFLGPLSREAAAIPARVWQGIFDGFSGLDLTRVASRIAVPVLCLAGSEDTLFDGEHRLPLARTLPSAKSVVMDGFGHNPHWEDPAQVALHVGQFLESLPAAARKA